jgi:ribonuclease HII
VIGIDEVGRGAWAGPLLVVAARQRISLPKDLTDSKLLTKKKRESLITEIEQACDIGEGWVEPAEIDEYGLSKAMQLAVRRALTVIEAINDEQIIMDGTVNYCEPRFLNVMCRDKADLTEPIVSAASIVAKIKRDNLMSSLAEQHPEYQFERHVGYATKTHIEALRAFGPCALHRMSYKPVKAYDRISRPSSNLNIF